MIGIEERGDVAIVRLDHRKVNVLDLEMLVAIAWVEMPSPSLASSS